MAQMENMAASVGVPALGPGSLALISDAETRSISPENPTGEKGKGGMAHPEAPTHPARELGQGWKCRPCIEVKPGETLDLASVAGSGTVQSMWFGGKIVTRDFILRIYWDGAEQPAVECPLPDFFASPWALQDLTKPKVGPFAPVNSMMVSVNPNRGLNCFWPMPFREGFRMTLENRNPQQSGLCFYQINYALEPVPDHAAYFHAQFRRVNPLPYGDVYTILDGVAGRGHYVGTSMGFSINNSNWWGEGEIKFYLDGDDEFPTICGTGTEDYFGGAFDWVVDGQYQPYTTPFLGMHQVLSPDGVFNSQHRHAMYRWHVLDPIRFRENLRVDIQALGWRSERRYLPGMHDICSVAYWYQLPPAAAFPQLPDRNSLEIV